MGSGMWGVGVSEWHGVWVKGMGGGLGIFRKILKKFPENFGEISGKTDDDPKTGNWYCEMRKQYFDKWSPGE